MLLTALQEFCGKHWRQRQCDKRTDDYGTCNNETKLAEQSTRCSFHKYDGEEHSKQGDRRRDNGEENFLCPVNPRFKGAHTFLNAVVNVFRHYDGVVHHKTYGKHDCQH